MVMRLKNYSRYEERQQKFERQDAKAGKVGGVSPEKDFLLCIPWRLGALAFILV
jgi:hypothetical protein